MTTPRQTTIALLNELAVARAQLKEVLSPYETQKAVLDKACTDATAELTAKIERLDEEIKRLALADPTGVFGEGSRRLDEAGLILGARPTERVEVDDEDAVIGRLQEAAKNHPDPATRIAAASCLRNDPKLNKTFIREHWDEFREWFEIFGLAVSESLSVSLTEKKPAKPRASKPLTKSAA